MVASRIICIGTANESNAIPEPLLNRFRRFQIDPPTAYGLKTIAQQIYSRHAKGIPGMPASIPVCWESRLSAVSLRQLSRLLQEAIGRAALRTSLAGKKLVVPREDDLPAGAMTKPLRPGFIQ